MTYAGGNYVGKLKAVLGEVLHGTEEVDVARVVRDAYPSVLVPMEANLDETAL